jgi:hypothetical protein
MFEIIVTRKRSCWLWRVCDQAGQVMIQGREPSRAEARYRGERALFQLLLLSGLKLAGRSEARR